MTDNNPPKGVQAFNRNDTPPWVFDVPALYDETRHRVVVELDTVTNKVKMFSNTPDLIEVEDLLSQSLGFVRETIDGKIVPTMEKPEGWDKR